MTFLKRACLAAGLCLSLEGCSDGALMGAAKMDQAKVWLERVNFKVSRKMNSNSPLSVHLVVAYEDGVLGQLAGMTADQYFIAEPQLRKDHDDDLDVVEWELVPGQEVESEDISLKKAYGKGAFVFARYSTPDAHRESVGQDQEITLHLDEKDFYITKNR